MRICSVAIGFVHSSFIVDPVLTWIFFRFDIFSLRTFATDWKKAKEEKDQETRQRLADERSVLIRDGSMSPELRKVLEEIFLMYSDCDDTMEEDGKSAVTLTSALASRLWYRCGMKLASLENILEAKDDDEHTGNVTLEDFLGVIEKVVEEDAAKMAKEPSSDSSTVSACEVSKT